MAKLSGAQGNDLGLVPQQPRLSKKQQQAQDARIAQSIKDWNDCCAKMTSPVPPDSGPSCWKEDKLSAAPSAYTSASKPQCVTLIDSFAELKTLQITGPETRYFARPVPPCITFPLIAACVAEIQRPDLFHFYYDVSGTIVLFHLHRSLITPSFLLVALYVLMRFMARFSVKATILMLCSRLLCLPELTSASLRLWTVRCLGSLRSTFSWRIL